MILEAKDEKLRLQREAEEEARAKRDRAPEPRAPAPVARRAARPARRHARGEEPQDHRPRARPRARARRARPPQPGTGRRAREGLGPQRRGRQGDPARGDPRGGRARRGQARALDRAPGPRRGPGEGPRDHRHRDAARRRRPHGGARRHGRPPPERRDEGPDHRPRGPQHPRARAGHGRRPHHRRHPRDRRPVRASTRSAARSRASPLTKLIADGRIHPGRIEEVVNKARAEVDLVIRQAGEQAAYDAGVPGLPPELVKLLGRLKYRTSYGQNVLVHCVETSHLAAIIAAELGRRRPGGQDRRPAPRHRQGASTTRSRARTRRSAPQIAQKHNMPFKVVNGIAAHHQEVEYACIEAPIVQVADAISASRPGRARRDDGDVRQAPRGPPGDRRELHRRRALVRGPGRARGPDPRPPRRDRRPLGDAGSPATSSRRSRTA